MSHIVWTTLPTRFDTTGTYYASIFVAPRIDAGTLAGTAFEDWPATLANASFRLSIENSGPLPCNIVNAPFDSALWQSLFPASTLVKPFSFRRHELRPLWSYSVDALMAGVDAMFTQVAQSSPLSQPLVGVPGSPLQVTLDKLAAANSNRIEAKRFYDAARNTGVGWDTASFNEQAFVAGKPYSPFERAAYLAKRFYNRPSTQASTDNDGNLNPHQRPQTRVFDFHEKIALLADHPHILRKLGLIIDVSVNIFAQRNVPVLPSEGNVWIDPVVAHGGSDLKPKTAYYRSGNLFIPRSEVQGMLGDVGVGVLRLDDASRFAAIQGEPDGDANKVVDFASGMINLAAKFAAESVKTGRPVPGPHPEGLPARRTSGFIVTRKNRSVEVQKRFTRGAALDVSLNPAISNGQQEVLFAEDVVRGYRVDVGTETTGFKSLLRRRVTYVSIGGEEVLDEGCVNAASATSDPDPSVPDMYLHEALFGWEGWSLAAPRPGRIITNPQNGVPEHVEMPNTPPPADFPFKAVSRVEPGSLTPMRFGQRYAFRARLVDLAGNSLAVDDPSFVHSNNYTPLQTFKRHEPISPPTLVLKNVVTEGESIEHLVVRSNGNGDAATYAAWLNQTYPDATFPAKTPKIYTSACERHVALPKTTQIVAEQHGRFDGAFAAGADRVSFFRRGTREEGTFADKRIASLSANDGYIDNNPNGAVIITPPQVPFDKRRLVNGAADTSSLTERRGDPLAPGEYVICAADQVMLPYLPDPAAGGVVVWRVDNGVQVLKVTSDQSAWPDVPVERLRLAAGSVEAVSVQNGAQQITLPPATILRLRYASTPSDPYLPHMAYWLDQSQAPEVKLGRHWMLTPSRELVLVHAVQKPITPATALLKPLRNYDDTFVTHDKGTISFHGRSTGHVDLVGTWQETLDLPSRPLPNDITGDPARGTELQTGHAFQIPVGYDASNILIPTGTRHELGDTRHRKITYKTVATTRYREYFPAALIADTNNISIEGPATGPGPIVSVPSSARPLSPKVVYVVPTFKWEGSADGKTSIRRGNGVRIYLDRPWYSSGEGEKLAALIYRMGLQAGVLDETVKDYCSRFGRDPIWDAKGNGPVVAASFKNGTLVQGAGGATNGLLIAEKQRRVDAAIFDVEFNETRRLWFTDIEFNAATYFPFLRLGLARYQQNSLPDIELSPMVFADFTQLVADRTATFTPANKDVTVKIVGPVAENRAGASLAAVPKLASPKGVTTNNVPRSHRLVAYFQVRQIGAVADMGWSDIGNEVTLAGYQETLTGIGTWSGKVPIPTLPAGAQVRVVVEEREYFLVDGPQTTSYRIVYVDTFNVR